MTAINFPSSPSNGDTHTVGGVTYTYNSAETKWKTTINSNAFLPLTGGTVSGNIDLQDNDKLLFGTGDDLEIYHDGSHSYIKDAGTGTLRIEASEVGILSADGTETMAQFVQNGSASLRHNNSTKLETTSSGVTVTGDLQFNSGYGSSATAYGVRAWINFDGTSGTIGDGRADGNMDAVTDNGVGDYTCNFTTDMPDANYAAVGTVIGSSNTDATNGFVNGGKNAATGTHTASAFRFMTIHVSNGATDYNQVQIVVIR